MSSKATLLPENIDELRAFALSLQEELYAKTLHIEKLKALLDEDKVIGALKLGIKADAVTITPVDEVFAK